MIKSVWDVVNMVFLFIIFLALAFVLISVLNGCNDGKVTPKVGKTELVTVNTNTLSMNYIDSLSAKYNYHFTRFNSVMIYK